MIPQLYQIYKNCHQAIAIDTRQIKKGGLFFALGQEDAQGIHKGNIYATLAIEEYGAAYAIINDPQLKAQYAHDERYILVQNGVETLQALATYHRQQLNIPILAIAGSNGKTTLKELLYRVLSKKYETFATQGNLNNHIGVPISILSLQEKHEIAIIEIGANHLYETALLSQITQPTHGIVTNCGKDHLGEYGSFENVIKANAELYDYLQAVQANAFVCTDDALLLQISNHVTNRYFYGSHTAVSGEITATPFLALDLKINNKTYALQTQLFGAFWRNAVVAAAYIGHYFDIANQDIIDAIATYTPQSLRSQKIIWKEKSVLLDCYNANPSSVEAFMQAAQSDKSVEKKVFIVGEMLELGQYEAEEHQQLIYQLVKDQAFEKVILVGKAFNQVNIPQNDKFFHFDTAAQAMQWLQQHPIAIDTKIYVKGSRGNKLETIFNLP